MSKRKSIDSSILELLKNKEWLEQKITTEGYSSSRLATELGTTRTTVEKYRVLYGIKQTLSPKELTARNYQNKSEEEKQTILNKRKSTNVELYGAENTFQSHAVKITETMVKKYGVKKALQHPELHTKQKKTMVAKYGVEFAVHNRELYQKQLDTILERYGANPGKLEQFQEKAKETNRQKYGVDYHTQQHISIENLTNLNNRTWLIDQHHFQKKTLTQIANEVGCNITTVYRYCVNNDVDIKYYYESAQQREVSDWLKSLGVSVETNNRSLINGELDIFLPEYNLAIEYCGVFWHSDIHDRITTMYHLNKLRQCQRKGIRLLTMYEDEWLDRQDQVKQKILSILGKQTKSIFARKCKIVTITDKQVKQDFFNANHIQGDGPGSITFGLEYDNTILAMMTFIQKPNKVYDLNRFASSVRVVGGFQKLLTHFQKTYDWNEILSFADLRWSEGNMYDVSGFELDKVLPPDYRYVINNKTHHKFNFRRNSLERFLPNFDPSLTEVQNMRNAGYYRIFNCGLLRYVLHNSTTQK